MDAAELLFAQYEEDVRVKSNPAGVVGMCTTMHAEFKKATLYNEELRSLPDFMKSMTSQYHNSLGLGKSFLKDSTGKSKKRARNNRTRANSRGNGYGIVAKEDPPDNKLLNFLLRPRPLNPTLDPILALAQVTISITEQEMCKEEVSATIIRMATVEEERHADFYIYTGNRLMW